MEPVEDDGHARHEQDVEDVNEDFLGLEHAVAAHDVLDDSEDGSDQDEHTRGVQDREKSSPGNGEGHALLRRLGVDAAVEKDGGNDEEAEKDDLHTKTRDDDGFSLASCICRICVCELCATCFYLSATVAARI